MNDVAQEEPVGEDAAEVDAAGEKLSEGRADSATEVPASSSSAVVVTGWKGFCSAFASLLSRELDMPDTPILSETAASKRIEDRRAEDKERKALAQQSRVQKDKGYVAPDITKKGFEMQLRKVATEGVVRLFNAVKDFHRRGMNDMEKVELTKLPTKLRAKRQAEKAEGEFKSILEQGPKAKSRRTATKQTAGRTGADPNAMDEFAD